MMRALVFHRLCPYPGGQILAAKIASDSERRSSFFQAEMISEWWPGYLVLFALPESFSAGNGTSISMWWDENQLVEGFRILPKAWIFALGKVSWSTPPYVNDRKRNLW
jgi:hypothetical protein